jgi:trk system potassium uptake protein TrkH
MKLRVSNDKLLIFSYFIGVILLGSLLLMLPGAWAGEKSLPYIDALFTSTSAVCVTGLASVDTALYTRFGQTIILFLIQLGGLGLITFTTMLVMLPRRKISLVSRGIVRDFTLDEVDYDPKKVMRNIIILTVSIELAGAMLLFPAFYARNAEAPVFAAIFHSVSAFCNAGFSIYSTNLEAYVADPVISLTIAGLIVAGGLGFVVWVNIAQRVLGRKKMLSPYSVTVILTTACLIAGGTIFFCITEWNGAYAKFPPAVKMLAALFQSITPRTAGFDTVPQQNLGAVSILATIFLMYVGGASGSTAGGIKVSTFSILLILALRGTDDITGDLIMRKRAISNSTVVKAVQIAMKAMGIIIASVLCVLAIEGWRIASGEMRIIQVIFECFSAFGTVGLSMGLTMSLSPLSKFVLILTMFSGRVGLVAMAMPTPGKKIEKLVNFARADHIVG